MPCAPSQQPDQVLTAWYLQRMKKAYGPEGDPRLVRAAGQPFWLTPDEIRYAISDAYSELLTSAEKLRPHGVIALAEKRLQSRLIDRQRQASRRPPASLGLDSAPEVQSNGDVSQRVAQYDGALTSLRQLPSATREAIVLRAAGLTPVEIAKRQGTSVAATRQRLSRGSRDCQKLMGRSEPLAHLTGKPARRAAQLTGTHRHQSHAQGPERPE
jgi:hypothetical protein